jgi:hypothetical protein
MQYRMQPERRLRPIGITSPLFCNRACHPQFGVWPITSEESVMSSIRRRVFVFLLAAMLIPAFSAGQAQAQCQGGGQRGMGARQSNGSMRAGRQGNNLQTGAVPQVSSLTGMTGQQSSLQGTAQQQATLQAAVNQATSLLDAAQQQGASQTQINQLTLLQQQLALLLASSQQQAVVGGLAATR